MLVRYFHDAAKRTVTAVREPHAAPQTQGKKRVKVTGWSVSTYLTIVSSTQGEDSRTTFPGHYSSDQDSAESAKRWYTSRLVSGLGEEIDKGAYDALAAEYEASFNAMPATKKAP